MPTMPDHADQSALATQTRLRDIHIKQTIELSTPAELLAELPADDAAVATVLQGRQGIEDILAGRDERLLVVVGPCSIHDARAALEYADHLARVAEQVREKICIVMRVYFEKPRTTVGWKGLIMDPALDGSDNIPEGLRQARRILLEVNSRGLPAGTEMLDPITPQYLADLVSWASIGARTTESQTHRQMASGLSMPVGFKNGTDGSMETAINAMIAAREPHAFLGIDADGRTCIVNTAGNPLGHLILRGGASGANYSADAVAAANAALQAANLSSGLLVDCSHANSQKDHTRQKLVFEDVIRQRVEDTSAGNAILGVMIESNLVAGNQKLAPFEQLTYGQSITDACIACDETERLLLDAAERL